MLWDEYIERCPEGYRYSRFCELYRGWASRLSVTMRQAYFGGDKLFIDYAGDTVPVIVDRPSGQVRPAQIFVADLVTTLLLRRMQLLTHPMLDQLGQLGLSGMAKVFAELEASDETAAFTHLDWLGLLVDRELTRRRNQRLAARLRYARLRQ